MSVDAQKKLIEKAITTTQLGTDGRLTRKQSERFVKIVRESTNFLPEVRTVRMRQLRESINKLHLGEAITRNANENTDSLNDWSPKYSAVDLTANKVVSAWNITTEAFQDALSRQNFEDDIMEIAAQRIGQDLEILGIQGDSSNSGSEPNDLLVKTDDGWDIKTNSAHILDANGDAISEGLLMTAKRTLPKHYRNDPNLAFIMSDDLWNDWIERISHRPTSMGDRALQSGDAVRPFGHRIIPVPNIPDTTSVTVTSAQPGRTSGTRQGPFEFTATAKTIKITSPSVSATNKTFTVGVLDTSQVAKEIEDTFSDLKAYDDETGRLVIETSDTGSSKSLTIAAGDTNDALSVLGLSAGTFTGTDSGSSGTALDSSFIWFGNPKNFILGIVDGPRMYAEYNKTTDRVEFVMYNQVDMEIENLDAIVKITNVRKATLF